MKNTNRKTTLKVLVRNGMQNFVRTVYENEDGRHFFKYNGEKYFIYQAENGIYKAPWFNRVEYV